MFAVVRKTTRLRSNGTPKIVVAERGVLFGIEYLQHGGGRIALDARAHLVDLIQHHDTIARSHLPDRLNDVSRQRADISAPVAAYFGLVVDAAQAHANEFAIHRPGDRLAKGCLANAWRSDKTEDRSLTLRGELADRQIFDDALLDLVQPIMVFIEDATRFRDIDRCLLRQGPGELDQPIEIGSGHAVLGGGFRHPFQPPQLLARRLLDLGRHLGLCNGLIEFGDLLRLAGIVAKLTLDGRQLFSQQHLALALVQRCLCLLSDFLTETQNLNALRREGVRPCRCGQEDQRSPESAASPPA